MAKISSPSNRLNELMEENNLKQVDILNKSKQVQKELNISMSKSALSQYVNGKQEPDQHRIYLLSKVLDVSEAWLMGFDVPKHRNEAIPSNLIPIKQTKLIPVIGRIACGAPILADQNIIDSIAFPVELLPSGEIFFLECRGDSMMPTIQDKALVMVRKQENVEDGEIAVVLLNGDEEATLKRIKRQGDLIMLLPDNTNHPPIVIQPTDTIRIVGKAIKTINNL